MEHILSRHEQLQDTFFVFNINDPHFLQLHCLEARSVSPHCHLNCVLKNFVYLSRPELLKKVLFSVLKTYAVTPIPSLNQDDLTKRVMHAFVESKVECLFFKELFDLNSSIVYDFIMLNFGNHSKGVTYKKFISCVYRAPYFLNLPFHPHFK